MGGVSCCGPRSFHPRLIQNHNILRKNIIFTSATKRRSWGALAKLAQIEEVEVTWLPAARTRFAIGMLKNSGILKPFQLELSKDTYIILWKDRFHFSEWFCFLWNQSELRCVNVAAQLSKPQTSLCIFVFVFVHLHVWHLGTLSLGSLYPGLSKNIAHLWSIVTFYFGAQVYLSLSLCICMSDTPEHCHRVPCTQGFPKI